MCEPECPIDAIKPDTDESVKDMEKWLLLNKKFSAKWPNISKKKILCQNMKNLEILKINMINTFQKNLKINMRKKKKFKKIKKVKK